MGVERAASWRERGEGGKGGGKRERKGRIGGGKNERKGRVEKRG